MRLNAYDLQTLCCATCPLQALPLSSSSVCLSRVYLIYQILHRNKIIQRICDCDFTVSLADLFDAGISFIQSKSAVRCACGESKSIPKKKQPSIDFIYTGLLVLLCVSCLNSWRVIHNNNNNIVTHYIYNYVSAMAPIRKIDAFQIGRQTGGKTRKALLYVSKWARRSHLGASGGSNRLTSSRRNRHKIQLLQRCC